MAEDFIIERIHNPIIAFSNALNALREPGITRAVMVGFYADYLLAKIDRWPELNRAIMEKWSRSSLEWIKKQAWKSLGEV